MRAKLREASTLMGKMQYKLHQQALSAQSVDVDINGLTNEVGENIKSEKTSTDQFANFIADAHITATVNYLYAKGYLQPVDQSKSVAEDDVRAMDITKRAFQAGFEISCEGYCGDNHDDGLPEYLERGFRLFLKKWEALMNTGGEKK